jgi:hypothetical protein
MTGSSVKNRPLHTGYIYSGWVDDPFETEVHTVTLNITETFILQIPEMRH